MFIENFEILMVAVTLLVVVILSDCSITFLFSSSLSLYTLPLNFSGDYWYILNKRATWGVSPASTLLSWTVQPVSKGVSFIRVCVPCLQASVFHLGVGLKAIAPPLAWYVLSLVFCCLCLSVGYKYITSQVGLHSLTWYFHGTYWLIEPC